ncbi:MAG: 30S ribosomal protein S8 [Candidatus Roizmanbacteria bacterium]
MVHSISDLVIRIKNGCMSGKAIIESPYSLFREEVLKKLLSLHFVKSYNITGEGVDKKFVIELAYEGRNKGVTDVKIFSKPGRRYYVTVKEIEKMHEGLGYAVISTPNGLLTHIEAKKSKTGGELLFHIR